MLRFALISLCSFAHLSGLIAEEAPRVRNVLFIVSDDLRASALSVYGDGLCRTPNLDRLARRSVVFDRAYCQGTVCGPSRTSFMYSRYRGTGTVTMGEHFRKHGYYSARAGKIFHMKVPGDIIAGTNGQDVAATWTERFNSQGNEAHTPGDYACLNLNIFTTDEENRQSTAMPHRMFVSVKYDGDGSDQPDHKTGMKITELLQQHGNKPFFLAAGFVRPHYPMVAPRQFFEPYPWQKMILPELHKDDLLDMPAGAITNSRSEKNGIDKYPDNQKRMWAAYYASITFMDKQLGRILDELDRQGLRNSTAIVFTSDHGYHLGDHTFWQKNNLHEQVIRVPMMISAPGIEPGRSQSIVELVDLFPTLVDLAGLPQPEGLHGSSLVPVMKDHESTVKSAALSYTKGVSWRTNRWAYTRYPDGGEELYDMSRDARQFDNLAKKSEYRELCRQFSGELDAKHRSLGITFGKVKKKSANKN